MFIVSAIGQAGKSDIDLMNADGTGSRNLTASSFPDQFLCHWANLSANDLALCFIGEWWD